MKGFHSQIIHMKILQIINRYVCPLNKAHQNPFLAPWHEPRTTEQEKCCQYSTSRKKKTKQKVFVSCPKSRAGRFCPTQQSKGLRLSKTGMKHSREWRKTQKGQGKVTEAVSPIEKKPDRLQRAPKSCKQLSDHLLTPQRGPATVQRGASPRAAHLGVTPT